MKSKKIDGPEFEKELVTLVQTIGENLYFLRKHRKESLQTVAKAVDISPDKLSEIESGLDPNCRVTVLGRLSRYYQVSLRNLATKGAVRGSSKGKPE